MKNIKNNNGFLQFIIIILLLLILISILLSVNIVKLQSYFLNNNSHENILYTIEQKTCSGKRIILINNCIITKQSQGYIEFIDSNNTIISLSGGIINKCNKRNYLKEYKKD